MMFFTLCIRMVFYEGSHTVTDGLSNRNTDFIVIVNELYHSSFELEARLHRWVLERRKRLTASSKQQAD